MSTLDAARRDLTRVLGSYLEGGRPDGVFHLAPGGPGSTPALADLDVPELHLDLLPEPPTEVQRAALATLGYVPGEREDVWTHPGGWRLVLCDHGTGWRAGQTALRALLLGGGKAAARYRTVFLARGREEADAALLAEALAHHARTVGFAPAKHISRALSTLPDLPWMVAGGLALDLHLGGLTRPHDDVDVVIPRPAQVNVRDALLAGGWRLDACGPGGYRPWTAPLDPPHHQVHARHPELPDVLMLDLLLTGLGDGLWHYRRDPRVTLPLAEARQFGPENLPYLAPQAVLLFKGGHAGRDPRGKDARDFDRVLPTLTRAARDWLAGALNVTAPGHPWLGRL
ncbi:hypothetical protein DAETH_20340 [Deinococcus aetherius]|uniref:Nucleotidyltransferase-like protein n=1 Tax=Deinococcus aetherius TaxID=200252 RepID=A0ABM8AE52_9DEIO|nr:hypothetical protein [Deinococcus aetherius]BDP42065.1 hypothetical protein DAETH_20340 [Deinococcus aetherius]